MSLVGQLQFTQGATVGPAGEAFVGTLGAGAVTCANGNNALALGWTYQLLDVPVGSSLSTSAPFSAGTSPTGAFTPDVAGSYQVMLTVAGVGNTQATDVRTVVITTANRSWIMPAYEDTNLTLNYPDPSAANTVGWKDALNKIFADLDAHGFFTDKSLGAAPTNVLTWSGTAWAPAAAGGGGVIWANDLAGSSSTTQQVAALTKSSLIPVTTGFKIGTNPAQTGLVGLPNNVAGITGRNAANNADVIALAVNASNQVVLGGTNAAGLLGNVGSVTTLQLANATTDFLKLGAPTATGAAYSATGLIRLGDASVAEVVISSRISGNTADVPILTTDGASGVTIGGGLGVSGTVNLTGAIAQLQSGTYALAVRNDVAGIFVSGCTTFLSASVATFAFDSGATLTEWDHKINGTTIMVVDTNKVRTKRGISRAKRVVATSTTLTAADDIVFFSATAQTATLPATPADGDKYTVGLNLGSAGTYIIAGNGHNVVSGGGFGTSITLTNSTVGQGSVCSVIYDSSLPGWIASTGY